ncbi:hypothetical protein ACHAQJ_008550 [Trichoderma viride]
MRGAALGWKADLPFLLEKKIFEPSPDFPTNPPPNPSPSSVSSVIPTPTEMIASIITTSMTTSTPSPTSTSHGNGFLNIAESGDSGGRILRGFLIGVAIGIMMSFALCCWKPCFRKSQRSRLQRRNDNIRRRLVVLEDEAWVNQNWPQRRLWDIGEDERQSHESQSHESQSRASHEEV